MNEDDAILYVDNSPSSREAKKLLRGAGLTFAERPAPSGYRAAYRMPVLFGLFNKFEGLSGIRIFVENSTLLSRSATGAKRRRR